MATVGDTYTYITHVARIKQITRPLLLLNVMIIYMSEVVQSESICMIDKEDLAAS